MECDATNKIDELFQFYATLSESRSNGCTTEWNAKIVGTNESVVSFISFNSFLVERIKRNKSVRS